MADYYSILGVPKTATEADIKAAFRRLAKLYHPDKNPSNPDAKNKFEQILKAYETLVHPAKKRRYDTSFYQATNTQHHSHGKQKRQKEWNFTEEELKRRQYYQTYYQTKQKAAQQAPPQSTYTDYKYVLLATPIAVALVLLIVSMFTKEPIPNETSLKNNVPVTNDSSDVYRLRNGDTPYSGYFGGIRTFNTNHHVHITNSTNYDLVFVLFQNNTNNYLQHTYMRNGSSAEFSKLPNEGVYWKCLIGKNWNPELVVSNTNVTGMFDSVIQIQNWKKQPVIFDEQDLPQLFFLNIVPKDERNKSYISSTEEFFEK